MKLFRKAGLALGAALLSVGAAGLVTPAHAVQDTNWPCAACLMAHR
jgi:hypothetical protein